MILEIFSILTFISIIALGFIVYFRGRRAPANTLFLFLALIMGSWVLALFFYEHPLFISSFWWIKIVYLIVFFMEGFFYYFHFFFPVEVKEKPFYLIYVYIILALPNIYMLFFTDFWVKDVVLEPWGYRTVLGPGYICPGILWGLYALFLLYGWRKLYFTFKEGVEKNQLKYVFLGFLIFIVSIMTIDVIIPVFTGNTALFWFSPVFSLPFIILVAFAVIKYHLFEVKVILTEFLVGLIGLVVLIQLFLAETIRARILNFGTLFLFCLIGYLLIKSTHREIKAKEILEQKVQERTKELEERTRESERRAEELKQRKEELEKFYNLTVGRELKMIELKKKIKDLEGGTKE